MRVVYSLDFEWKADEKWMLAKALRIAAGLEPWPWVGMRSGVGTENPGASVWVFAALAWLFPDPVSMAAAVAWLNVLALWGFALWVLKTWRPQERALGLAGVALFAVSPLPILFARKLWAQDLLPVLLLPWLWSHARRERAAAAFAWGLLGALLGQLHMSGFFAAAALVLATLIVARAPVRWRAWFAGSAIGALPLLPWLTLLSQAPGGQRGRAPVYSLEFFSHAFKIAWGLDLKYALGSHFRDFLRDPRLFGLQTWLVGAAHVLLLGGALLSLVLLLRRWRELRLSSALRIYALTLLLGGLSLHLTRVRVHAHYLIAFSPLLHIAAAWLLWNARRALLWSALVLQLLISACFLMYIHVHGGAPRGDYGVSYGAQQPAERALP